MSGGPHRLRRRFGNARGVPAAVAEAGLMTDEHFAGAETVSRAGRGAVGLPVMMSRSFTAVGA